MATRDRLRSGGVRWSRGTDPAVFRCSRQAQACGLLVCGVLRRGFEIIDRALDVGSPPAHSRVPVGSESDRRRGNDPSPTRRQIVVLLRPVSPYHDVLSEDSDCSWSTSWVRKGVCDRGVVVGLSIWSLGSVGFGRLACCYRGANIAASRARTRTIRPFAHASL